MAVLRGENSKRLRHCQGIFASGRAEIAYVCPAFWTGPMLAACPRAPYNGRHARRMSTPPVLHDWRERPWPGNLGYVRGSPARHGFAMADGAEKRDRVTRWSVLIRVLPEGRRSTLSWNRSQGTMMAET